VSEIAYAIYGMPPGFSRFSLPLEGGAWGHVQTLVQSREGMGSYEWLHRHTQVTTDVRPGRPGQPPELLLQIAQGIRRSSVMRVALGEAFNLIPLGGLGAPALALRVECRRGDAHPENIGMITPTVRAVPMGMGLPGNMGRMAILA
jgi:hypothetical protein